MDNLAQKPSLDIRLTYDFLYLILYIVILLFFVIFQKYESLKEYIPDLEWMKDYIPESETLDKIKHNVLKAFNSVHLPEKVPYFLDMSLWTLHLLAIFSICL